MDILQKFVRGQRNPLLDRIDFYKHIQQCGETFDNLYAELRKPYKSCDFPTVSLCPPCQGRCCSSSKDQVTQVRDETLRDRIIIGVADDETRHKLLAESKLALEQAIKIYRAEEAAQHTQSGIPETKHVNAARSQYTKQRMQASHPTSSPLSTTKSAAAPAKEKSSNASSKCSQCGRSAHTKAACLAKDKRCNKWNNVGHFLRMCPKNGNKLGQLRLQRTAKVSRHTVSVATQLKTEDDAVNFAGFQIQAAT